MKSVFVIIICFTKVVAGYSGPADTLRFAGTVVSKFELWDRRSNPMMGQPDVLKEIYLSVVCDSVIDASVKKGDSLRLRIKGEKELIRYKKIGNGQRGWFCVLKSDSLIQLVSFQLLTVPGTAVKPAVSNKPGPVQINEQKSINAYLKMRDKEFFREAENIPGKLINASDSLQRRAVKVIGKKYGLKQAEFVSLNSFRGPAPPPGGYVYWGVRGMKDGSWYVWQPGRKGKLREGRDLEDPKRYSK